MKCLRNDRWLLLKSDFITSLWKNVNIMLKLKNFMTIPGPVPSYATVKDGFRLTV